MSYLSNFIVRDKEGNETRILRKDSKFSTLVKRLDKILAAGCEIENLRTRIRCAQ